MDEDLPFIELIQDGDESGLVELMTRHKLAVFRFIIRYVGNEADAAELTEETFYRVFMNASKFRPKARVRTWIFAIAANLSRDSIRRRSKFKNQVSLSSKLGESTSIEGLDVIPDSGTGPIEEAYTKESIRAIEEAIHGLPEKLKFPFVFCILENNSYEECAEVLKVSTKTVETRIYRARLKLRKLLDHLPRN
jgi:RNA polymerase sigma-70 factor (ECF subfamily)